MPWECILWSWRSKEENLLYLSFLSSTSPKRRLVWWMSCHVTCPYSHNFIIRCRLWRFQIRHSFYEYQYQHLLTGPAAALNSPTTRFWQSDSIILSLISCIGKFAFWAAFRTISPRTAFLFLYGFPCLYDLFFLTRACKSRQWTHDCDVVRPM